MTDEEKIEKANKGRIHRGVLSVDYDEFNQESYTGLELKNMDSKKVMKFNTGDFVIDFLMYKLYIESSMKSTFASVMHSSSVDHFYMDGNKFKEIYVEWNEDGLDGKIIGDGELMRMPMHEWDKYGELPPPKEGGFKN
jgi:hypothetical protein